MNFDIYQLVVCIFSMLNFFALFRQYKFTKKTSNEALYLKSEFVKENDLKAKTEDEINPNKENIFQYVRENEIIDFHYMNSVRTNKIDLMTKNGKFDISGFPEKIMYHNNIIWVLEIKNNSNYFANNVLIKYEFVIYRDIVEVLENGEYNINGDSIYKKIPFEYKFDYIAPNSSKRIYVSNLCGQFNKAHLVVKKLKSDNIDFLKKSFIIDRYRNPILDYLGDGQDAIAIYGVNKENCNNTL